MTCNRHIALLFALLAAVALSVGTGGFSAVSADRNAQIAVVSDDEAYLGVAETCDGDDLAVTITNRFADATLDVDLTVNRTTKTIVGLAPGGQETRTFNASLFDDTDQLAVDAAGDGVSVYLTRPVPTGCG